MKTTSIYIFEAGSTKTDVLIYHDNVKTIHSLCGFNPNREDTNFSTELSALNIPENAEIYFYGSGANGIKNKEKIYNLFNSNNITIQSDALGAARALLKTKPGIVCILGTGGNVVYYDGIAITDQKGGYGYLIDDYGGGLELSRVVVSQWLNDGFSSETSKAIEAHYSLPKSDFVSNFYITKDLHYLSSICQILPTLASGDYALNHTIQNYFNAFVERHILPMCEKHSTYNINIVGSIGQYFNNWLKDATHSKLITLNKSLAHPITELLEYHLTQK